MEETMLSQANLSIPNTSSIVVGVPEDSAIDDMTSKYV